MQVGLLRIVDDNHNKYKVNGRNQYVSSQYYENNYQDRTGIRQRCARIAVNKYQCVCNVTDSTDVSFHLPVHTVMFMTQVFLQVIWWCISMKHLMYKTILRVCLARILFLTVSNYCRTITLLLQTIVVTCIHSVQHYCSYFSSIKVCTHCQTIVKFGSYCFLFSSKLMQLLYSISD